MKFIPNKRIFGLLAVVVLLLFRQFDSVTSLSVLGVIAGLYLLVLIGYHFGGWKVYAVLLTGLGVYTWVYVFLYEDIRTKDFLFLLVDIGFYTGLCLYAFRDTLYANHLWLVLIPLSVWVLVDAVMTEATGMTDGPVDQTTILLVIICFAMLYLPGFLAILRLGLANKTSTH